MTDRQPASSEKTSAPQVRLCAMCGKPIAPEADTFPFCSSRCRQIDLGQWLNGQYVISRPIEQADLDEV